MFSILALNWKMLLLILSAYSLGISFTSKSSLAEFIFGYLRFICNIFTYVYTWMFSSKYVWKGPCRRNQNFSSKINEINKVEKGKIIFEEIIHVIFSYNLIVVVNLSYYINNYIIWKYIIFSSIYTIPEKSVENLEIAQCFTVLKKWRLFFSYLETLISLVFALNCDICNW